MLTLDIYLAVADHETVLPGVEYPPRADLRRDIYRPLPVVAPGTVDADVLSADTIRQKEIAQTVIDRLNAALDNNDALALADCFHEGQAFWRDIVALTCHLRTFSMPKVVAAALLHMKAQRGIEGHLKINGAPHFAVVNPLLVCFHLTSTRSYQRRRVWIYLPRGT